MTIENKSNFPKGVHFAALIFKTEFIYHEGDERSRTHPGHGYPAYTETIDLVSYKTFKDKEDMENWVIKEELKGKDKAVYQLISVQPINPKIKATLEY